MSVPRVRNRVLGQGPHRRAARADSDWLPDGSDWDLGSDMAWDGGSDWTWDGGSDSSSDWGSDRTWDGGSDWGSDWGSSRTWDEGSDWSSDWKGDWGSTYNWNSWERWSPAGSHYDWSTWGDWSSDSDGSDFRDDFNDFGAETTRNVILFVVVAPIGLVILFFICRYCRNELEEGNDPELDQEDTRVPSNHQSSSSESNHANRQSSSPPDSDYNSYGESAPVRTTQHSGHQSNSMSDMSSGGGRYMSRNGVVDTDITCQGHPDPSAPPAYYDTIDINGDIRYTGNDVAAVDIAIGIRHDNGNGRYETENDEAVPFIDGTHDGGETRDHDSQPPPPAYETVMANLDKYQKTSS